MSVKTAKKSNIEAILPLSELQQGMLIHHLYNPTQDEGFLHLGFRMKGKLDSTNFKQSWQLVIDRHSILRTTVHWEKIEKPVQVIHAEKVLNWTFLDWSEKTANEFKQELKNLKSAQKEIGLNFKENPLVNFTLINLGEDEHFFLWPCHHLLLDGWSGNNLVKDVLVFYDALCKNETPVLPTLPSLKSYIGWLKKKNPENAASFWSSYFDGFQKTHLLCPLNTNQATDKTSSENIRLTETETIGINNLAKRLQVSPNTLIQGAWGLLLGEYFQSDDVVFGASVSGRSNDFPNMDLLTGMFMNVLPIRSQIKKQSDLKEWLREFQKNQVKAMEYEHITLNSISSYINKDEGRPLFDSLLVFENFPWKGIKSGAVEILDYRSGATTNYPISLMVIPDNALEFNFLFRDDQITKETRQWILENWHLMLKVLASEKVSTVKELTNCVEVFKRENQAINSEQALKSINGRQYVAPRNDIELKLVKIWENLLGIDSVGITDDYFELGGKSLMAIKMFSLIESKMGVKLPPTTLLFATTIEKITEKLLETKNEGLANWEFLVPLKTQGESTPLFCVHGGEGHVLFYKPLPKFLGTERPVYLLQPKGINGDGPMHTSTEAMGRDYLSEILQVQTEGPYNIMFFCYSALAIEMASLIEGRGQKANLIIVDSSAQAPIKNGNSGILTRVNGYMIKLWHAPIMTLKSSIIYRYRQFIEPVYIMLTKNKTTADLVKIRKQLHEVYEHYTWKKINSQCTLILTNIEATALKEEKIQLWQHWSNTKVKILYNSGNHLNLFEEPHIRSLAKNVEMICNTSEE